MSSASTALGLPADSSHVLEAGSKTDTPRPNLLPEFLDNEAWFGPVLLRYGGQDMSRLTTTCKHFGRSDWCGSPCSHNPPKGNCGFCTWSHHAKEDVANEGDSAPLAARVRRGQWARLALLDRVFGRDPSTLWNAFETVGHLFQDELVGRAFKLCEKMEKPSFYPLPQKQLCSEGSAVCILRGAGGSLEGWEDDGNRELLTRCTSFSPDPRCLSFRFDELGLDGALGFQVCETWSGRDALLAATEFYSPENYLTVWTVALRTEVFEGFKVAWHERFADIELEILATAPLTCGDVLGDFSYSCYDDDVELYAREFFRWAAPEVRAIGEQMLRLTHVRPFVLMHAKFAAMATTLGDPRWDEGEAEDISFCEPQLFAEASFVAGNGKTYLLRVHYAIKVCEDEALWWRVQGGSSGVTLVGHT